MYHAIVRRVVYRGFRHLSAGDFNAVLRQFSPDVRFSFAGEHAMGGQWRGIEGARAWFQRVHRLFPGLELSPFEVRVSGWPWNTIVRTRFTVRATLPGAVAYTNEGEQWLRLRWGRVVEDRLREDTRKLTLALEHLARHGIAEALAAPIPGGASTGSG